jgi:hypothetical protein
MTSHVTKNEDTRPVDTVEPERVPYAKPTLTELGLLRTLTQGSF